MSTNDDGNVIRVIEYSSGYWFGRILSGVGAPRCEVLFRGGNTRRNARRAWCTVVRESRRSRELGIDRRAVLMVMYAER